MRPIIQEETTGCAIASSAAIAGITYQEAKDIANNMGISASDPLLWSDTKHIRGLLNTLGYSTNKTETPFTDWACLPYRALLSIKWRIQNSKPVWHWVVFIRKNNQAYVLDSNKTLKTNIRTDFGRMRPKWHIAIHAPLQPKKTLKN